MPEKLYYGNNEAAVIVGAASNSLKQSRNSGVLFGKPAPRYEKRGKKVIYRLNTLREFNEQFNEQQNTAQNFQKVKQ